ncbi:hypothetical protein P8T65_46190 [Streptomyces sp. 11x1]|nr:hypothetical protein [Streptomyces sp. 11x1]WNZ14228.1 hypothetical protein P8T65_46190 [Streptomyces sp. 11x1]
MEGASVRAAQGGGPVPRPDSADEELVEPGAVTGLTRRAVVALAVPGPADHDVVALPHRRDTGTHRGHDPRAFVTEHLLDVLKPERAVLLVEDGGVYAHGGLPDTGNSAVLLVNLDPQAVAA